MDQAGAEHAHHVSNDFAVKIPGLLRRECDIVQPWRCFAVFVGNHLHQQHAIHEPKRFRYSHASACQTIKGVHLGVQPGVFLFLLPVAGFLAHGAGATAVTNLAAFLVLNGLFEATFLSLLVHLGAANTVTAAHYEHLGLLAAHQLVEHFVHHAVIDKGLQSFGYLHRSFRSAGWAWRVIGCRPACMGASYLKLVKDPSYSRI